MPRKSRLAGNNPHGFTPKHDPTPANAGCVTPNELGPSGVPFDDEVKKILADIDKGMSRIDEQSIPPALAAKPVLALPAPVDPVYKEVIKKAVLSAKEKRRQKTKELMTITNEDTMRVSLMQDNKLEYPTLCLEVFIVGDQWEERAFAFMFSRAICKKAPSIEKADLVVFTGGSDVDPQLYGEMKHSQTQCSSQRDDSDMTAYMTCLSQGIPMLGICRGAQFLHVMNGGKLYQHVDNHYGDHEMWDVQKKIKLDRVSSSHHQMVIPQREGFTLVATANKATNRWRNPSINDIGHRPDVEAFFYRDTCCIGIQGHPEYRGYDYFAKWALELVEDCVITNPDIEWRKTEGEKLSQRRMKESFMEERNERLKKRSKALT